MKEWGILPRCDKGCSSAINQNAGERAASKDKYHLRYIKFSYIPNHIWQILENMDLSSGETLGLAIKI